MKLNSCVWWNGSFLKHIQAMVVKHLDANNQHVKEASPRRYLLVILIKPYSLAEM